ncbi:MAG: hypothetical protein M9927_12705 [Anaerolineae bacterium]|nr:hypothetical protein [Anaerolineae bacterium]
MRRRLEMQADRIEAVLASHKVQGRVWGGTVTPRFIRFQVMTSLDTKVNRVSGLSEEIALSLGVPATRVHQPQRRHPGRSAAAIRSGAVAAALPAAGRRDAAGNRRAGRGRGRDAAAGEVEQP